MNIPKMNLNDADAIIFKYNRKEKEFEIECFHDSKSFKLIRLSLEFSTSLDMAQDIEVIQECITSFLLKAHKDCSIFEDSSL